MNKLYVYAILAIVIIGFIKWYSDNQYMAGYNAHKSEMSDAKDEADSTDTENVKTIIKWRTETKIVYRDRVNEINNAKDTTGCLDTKLTDMGISLH